MRPTTEQIGERLAAAFPDARFEVIDESHLHAGHAGARGGGHFRAVVVSQQFDGKSPVERQRLIYDALASAMGSEIHALSMRTLTPAEWTSGG